ncbi:MAG TPA: hypothetical protein VIE64_03675 [Solirubrobacterales bacterium]
MAEERRKRKERDGELTPRERMQRGYAQAEERNREVRESLQPLAEGERPVAVTVAAVISALIAAVFWASAGVAAFTDTTVDGQEPAVVPIVAFAVLMTMMTWGMWRARYWAVLGFQMLLVLFLLAGMGGLVSATTVVQALSTGLLLVLSGVLFFFMVKAMARIQMPNRRTD